MSVPVLCDGRRQVLALESEASGCRMQQRDENDRTAVSCEVWNMNRSE